MKQVALLSMFSAIASAQAAVLHDNGPMSTGPTHHLGNTAPVGTTFSELQSVGAVSNTVLGYSVNYLNATATGPLHQADDFTVPAGGWSVSSFVVYGFRTNGSTTEQFNTGVLRIWDGVPGQPGSNIVAGDLTTNILTFTDFSGIYRTGRSSSSLTSRPIMSATLTFPTAVSLPQGTYWMDYGLTSAGNTFAPLVTRPGELQPVGANAMLYTSFQWYTMVDTNSGSQMEVPFQVIGSQNVELGGTMELGGSVSAFAMPRAIAYSIMQGTSTVGSGVITANSSSSAISLAVASTATGSAELVLDGSSWLRRRVTITLTGSGFSLGTISMVNGDVDGSGEVDAADIDAVIADFGSTYPGGSTPDADVDVSGEVDAADIDLVIAGFGSVDE
ncbi:MAG: hypothetical protein JNK63_08065 [Chthonomonas sp.]|nr:hypothetical protein [Chthonomonas sp.]